MSQKVTHSEKVVKDFKESIVVLTDIDEEYISKLGKKFQSNKSVFINKVNLFNKIVPTLKAIERYGLFRRVGISLIVVLTKPAYNKS